MKDSIVSPGGMIIKPDQLMIGQQYAFSVNNLLLVSPAIFDLLQDDSTKEQVMKQVKVVSLKELIEEECENYFIEQELEKV